MVLTGEGQVNVWISKVNTIRAVIDKSDTGIWIDACDTKYLLVAFYRLHFYQLMDAGWWSIQSQHTEQEWLTAAIPTADTHTWFIFMKNHTDWIVQPFFGQHNWSVIDRIMITGSLLIPFFLKCCSSFRCSLNPNCYTIYIRPPN